MAYLRGIGVAYGLRLAHCHSSEVASESEASKALIASLEDNMQRLLSLALVSLLGMGLALPADASPLIKYTAVDLGTLGGTRTVGNDLNDSGQVTGESTLAGDNLRHAFITGRNGHGMTDLGTLRGGRSIGTGINNVGQVAGYASATADVDVAFVTGPDGVGMRIIQTRPGAESAGRAINNAGQVTGEFIGGPSHLAFLTGPNGAGLRIIGDPNAGGGTLGLAVNNSGQVTGQSVSHAFITGPKGIGMTDLGTLGGVSSTGLGINDKGQVVGRSDVANSNSRHAFMTGPNGSGMIDLGTLGGFESEAYDINNRGQVVGVVSLWTQSGDAVIHAFFTGPNGLGMTDLNTLIDLPSNVYFQTATAINNRGQIVANASDGRAYLLSPFAIPEPGTGALVLTSLWLMGFMVRKRNNGQQEAVTNCRSA